MAPRRQSREPQPRRTYRPAMSHNLLVVLAAMVFLTLAVACGLLADDGSQYLAIPLGILGIVLVLVAAARFRTRIQVGEYGLSRSPAYPMGFVLGWNEVESWDVRRIEHFHRDRPVHFAGHFCLAAGRRPVQVAEEDVNRPGFDTFLRDIRQYIGGRER